MRPALTVDIERTQDGGNFGTLTMTGAAGRADRG